MAKFPALICVVMFALFSSPSSQAAGENSWIYQELRRQKAVAAKRRWAKKQRVQARTNKPRKVKRSTVARKRALTLQRQKLKLARARWAPGTPARNPLRHAGGYRIVASAPTVLVLETADPYSASAAAAVGQFRTLLAETVTPAASPNQNAVLRSPRPTDRKIPGHPGGFETVASLPTQVANPLAPVGTETPTPVKPIPAEYVIKISQPAQPAYNVMRFAQGRGQVLTITPDPVRRQVPSGNANVRVADVGQRPDATQNQQLILAASSPTSLNNVLLVFGPLATVLGIILLMSSPGNLLRTRPSRRLPEFKLSDGAWHYWMRDATDPQFLAILIAGSGWFATLWASAALFWRFQ